MVMQGRDSDTGEGRETPIPRCEGEEEGDDGGGDRGGVIAMEGV